MEKIKFLLILIFINCALFAQSSANAFKADWYASEMDNTTITIFQSSDGLWYGKIINSTNKENIGKYLLEKMRYNPSDKSLEGQLKNPENKMVVKATLTLEGNNKLKIVGKKLLFTKTVYFIKKG
ncbi:hypothetical protein [Flavobacterium sp.]|uniref:hypothetical protein n=1 Tax=Flavobacterium sp. TaxID=239 RepID=UPI0026192919|nr:hypothetical protein [Flavobacterium sp.]